MAALPGIKAMRRVMVKSVLIQMLHKRCPAWICSRFTIMQNQKASLALILYNKCLPTWDETIVPAGEVYQYLTIARRKGTDWYIGTINSTKAKSLKLPLNFLPAGKYRQKYIAIVKTLQKTRIIFP